LRALIENGMGWAINGMAGPGGPPLVTAKLGEALLFEVSNRTAFDQPLHVHGHVWRVLQDNVEDAWRDTAVVPAKQSLKLAMVADNPGSWAIQSLVAERADGGLLAAFTVE
ncbi:MAG: multicopper oxidase domain-containing protein, partial [Aestuariivirga sp.]